MRHSAGLFGLALVVFACTEGPSADTIAETSGDDPGTEDDVGSDSETTTDDGEAESDDVPDCTPGAFGCTCAEGDTCSPDLACVDGMCTFSDCTATFEGCMCGPGDTCLDGLFCVDGICGCLPGSIGCTCIEGGMCEGDLSCIDGACWLASAYPNCGWDEGNGYYYCGFDIAHPDYPIDCPPELVEGQPCPPDLTFIGCCDAMGTWWCQNNTTTFAACG
jgi:hypothetical protein